MFRSWKIGRLLGIDLYLHSTFLLLLGWIGLNSLAYSDPVLIGLSWLLPLILFSIVVMHELGHALAARRFGIETRDITLYPIGGIARLRSAPTTPGQEMLVAAAGPAVNLGLAALTIAATPLLATSPVAAYLGGQFLMFNLGLGLFNLLPAFPMDGGRILRAFLTRRSNHLQATRTAALWGRRLAWVLGLAGVFTANLSLVMVAGFVWISATAESLGDIVERPKLRIQRDDPNIIEAEYWEVKR